MNDKDFQQLTEELKALYLKSDTSGKKPDKAIALCSKIIKDFKKNFSLQKLDAYIDLELTIANNRKKYQKYLEEELLRYLHTLFFGRFWKAFPTPTPLLNEALVNQETDAQKKLAHQSALKLLDLVEGLFEVKIPRDSFANQRKARALQILAHIWNYYNTEKGVNVCLEALKSKGEEPVIEAAAALGDYYELQSISPPKEVLALINRQIEKSKHVYAVRACANFLVTTKVLNKYNAEERVRDWKRRNDYPIF